MNPQLQKNHFRFGTDYNPATHYQSTYNEGVGTEKDLNQAKGHAMRDMKADRGSSLVLGSDQLPKVSETKDKFDEKPIQHQEMQQFKDLKTQLLSSHLNLGKEPTNYDTTTHTEHNDKGKRDDSYL
jgi:hypothetical protein